MLLLRCAWHPRYLGYPKIYRITSWKTPGVRFSDGMCDACARRWRADFRAGLEREASNRFPALVPAWMLRGGLAIAFASAVVLAAQPLERSVLDLEQPSASVASPADDRVIAPTGLEDRIVDPVHDPVAPAARTVSLRRHRRRFAPVAHVAEPASPMVERRAEDLIVRRTAPSLPAVPLRTVAAPVCPCRSVRSVRTLSAVPSRSLTATPLVSIQAP